MMTTALADHQFEILPSEDAAAGYVFGLHAPVELDQEGFDPGDRSWITQDSINTRRGVRAGGRDVPEPKTWTWESFVNQDDVATAVDVLEGFDDAWSPEELVRQPSEQTALRYCIAGRTRRVYGRPRHFSAPPTNLILNGFIPVTHDFDLVDVYTYDDQESSAQIAYASSVSGGGFVLPAALPVATIASEGNGSDAITVSGTARAYPIIRFNGPWTNPAFITDEWTLRWEGSIAADDWVEIDTRPWKLTVLTKSGASAVGGLPRQTWLEDCYFAPKSQPQISLDGLAPGGGATATVRWRNTWKSL